MLTTQPTDSDIDWQSFNIAIFNKVVTSTYPYFLSSNDAGDLLDSVVNKIEIYAIPISATYIGSSISITGVILAMVLIAIAAAYWYDGKLSKSLKTCKQALLKDGHVLSLAAISHAIACIVQIPLLAVMVYSIENSIIAVKGVGILYGVGLMLGSTCITLITQFLTLEYESE